VKILIFGATGMIGQGVLRECLRDPDVRAVTAVGRSASGVQHAKLRDIIHRDLHELRAIEPEFAGTDACFFCLGVTSAGMSEADYEPVTYGITAAAAEALVKVNGDMTFVFVSGAGADSSERGRVMWARVKGKSENMVLRLFRRGYVFRPAVVQPTHGIRSRTLMYNLAYSLGRPLMPLVRAMFPGYVLTTEELGRAMLLVARNGAPKRLLESRDIKALVESGREATS
jgi:uncharacterized protein YbjT (DUF2867 family)